MRILNILRATCGLFLLCLTALGAGILSAQADYEAGAESFQRIVENHYALPVSVKRSMSRNPEWARILNASEKLVFIGTDDAVVPTVLEPREVAAWPCSISDDEHTVVLTNENGTKTEIAVRCGDSVQIETGDR